ncbi:EAL domain-containing protein [Pseudoalteromonas sp. S558]|uniref:EAL domain-containing protein n=1 Tax=Pseudoalteromonas sp. S558 TaxID=2066515 RepID=UPI0033914E83
MLIEILNNTSTITLTSEQAMQQVRLWFLNQFKAIYLLFLVLSLIALNLTLNNALHDKAHRSGQQFVKQIYELQIDPIIDSQIVTALAQSRGFMLKLDPSSASLIQPERDVFSYKTLNISLYHYPSWIVESYLFILLNLIIFGTARWFYKWRDTLKLSQLNSLQYLIAKPSTADVKKIKSLIKPLKSRELRTLDKEVVTCHSLYVLIECDCRFDKHTDQEVSFKILIIKSFPELRGSSFKLLDSGSFAITLLNVPITELDRYIERLYQRIFLLCQQHQKTIVRKNIKVGACDYCFEDDQTNVYQLAKSALTLSQFSLLQHCHRLSLSDNQEKGITSKQIIENIKTNKFVLSFQPLFDLTDGDILQHEAIIKVRYNTHGLLDAKSYITQVKTAKDALMIDKSILTKILKLVVTENSPLTVSINLHPENWLSTQFWGWLSVCVDDLKLSSRLQFEISDDYFFAHKAAVINAFRVIKKDSAHIILDNVNSSKNIPMLINYKEVCGLKLSYQLVHLINEKTQHQKQIKRIINAGKLLNLPVYAVGVETQKELLTLTKLGVAAAQGFYFSRPLQELTEAVFH